MAKANRKTTSTNKSAAAGNSDKAKLKALKTQLAEQKKQASAEKKSFQLKLKQQQTEFTAKLNHSVAEAYAKGFSKAQEEAHKIEVAREKALEQARKKFDASNKLKAPAAPKAANKAKASKKSANKKRGRKTKAKVVIQAPTVSPLTQVA